MKEKLLVTGGAGFIGSHLCEMLLESSYQVRVLDNFSTGSIDNIKQIAKYVEIIDGDITNYDDCKKAVDGVKGVFHLAAMSKVAPSIASVEMIEYCNNQNVNGTINILTASKQALVSKVIYSASSTYYGNQLMPHLETMPPDCLTPYALTKYIGELYCKQFNDYYELPTVSLRYFQVCGKRQPSIGPYAVVAGIFIQQMLNGLPLTIHGDGSQKRDFVHVRDVALANIKVYESEIKGVSLNIGTGISHSIKYLADLISDNQILGLPRRSRDSNETCADTKVCENLLNWKPSIGIEAIVKELLDDKL
jgi:UDP-glucose 4-epimerase